MYDDVMIIKEGKRSLSGRRSDRKPDTDSSRGRLWGQPRESDSTGAQPIPPIAARLPGLFYSLHPPTGPDKVVC